MSEDEKNKTVKIFSKVKNLLLFRISLFQEIKEWWERSIFNKFFAIAILVLAVMTAFITFCDFFERFDLNLCPAGENVIDAPVQNPKEGKGVIDAPVQNPKEIARKLFNKNSANLRVTIVPIPPLNVNQKISLHITNNSNKDGYFLAFSIDSEGQLFSFVSEIYKALFKELQYIPAYLQINKGETIVIPQPNVPEDPLVGIRVGNNVGK